MTVDTLKRHENTLVLSLIFCLISLSVSKDKEYVSVILDNVDNGDCPACTVVSSPSAL